MNIGLQVRVRPPLREQINERTMSNKLNANELAYDRRVGLLWTRDMERAYAAAIREVAQPIADERDEYREAIVDAIASFDDGDLDTANISRLRAILAKYPKP